MCMGIRRCRAMRVRRCAMRDFPTTGRRFKAKRRCGPRGKDFVVEIASLLRQGMMMVIDGGRARGGFSYVDNVAAAMMDAAASAVAVGRAYNLCDETGVTWREYTDALADALDYR